MRTRLRVPYPGQRFPHAQAGHQDAEKGPGPTGAGVQDVQSDQESHTSRAQGPVRREKRMRRVVYARGYARSRSWRALGTTGQCFGDINIRSQNKRHPHGPRNTPTKRVLWQNVTPEVTLVVEYPTRIHWHMSRTGAYCTTKTGKMHLTTVRL